MKISPYFSQIRWWLSAALLFITVTAALLFFTRTGSPQVDPDWTHEVTAEHEEAVARALESATLRVQILSNVSPEAFTGVLRQAFGSRLSFEAERDLLVQAARGELPLPRRILVVPDAVLPSDAAYAREDGGTIFLNAVYDRDDEALTALILHEWAHHLDATLGIGDSHRDEGALFLAGIRHGGPTSAPFFPFSTAGLDDHASIVFEGRTLSVECGFFDFLGPVNPVKLFKKIPGIGPIVGKLDDIAGDAANKVARGAVKLGGAALNTVKSAVQLTAAGLAAATGDSDAARALLNKAGSSITDAGHGFKGAGSDALAAAAGAGRAFNAVTNAIGEVHPALGMIADVGLSLTPAGPFIAVATAYSGVHDAIDSGEGIGLAFANAGLQVAGKGMSRLKLGGKALPTVFNKAKPQSFLSKVASYPGKKASALLAKMKAKVGIKPGDGLPWQSKYRLTKATAAEKNLANYMALSHPKTLKRLIQVETAMSAANKGRKAGAYYGNNYGSREEEYPKKVLESVDVDLKKNAIEQQALRDEFNAIKQRFAAEARAGYQHQLGVVMAAVGIEWPRSSAIVNEARLDPLGITVLTSAEISYQNSFRKFDYIPENKSPTFYDGFIYNDYLEAIQKRGADMKQLLDEDLELQRNSLSTNIKNAVEMRKKEINVALAGLDAAKAEAEQASLTIDTNLRKEKSAIGVAWEELDVTRVAELKVYEQQRQSLQQAIDPLTRPLPPELEEIRKVTMPQLEADGKQLAQGLIQIKRKAVQDKIAALDKLNQEFKSYSTQVENTANSNNAQLQQYVADGKRLAQELFQVKKQAVQGRIAALDKLNQEFKSYSTQVENTANSNNAQMQQYQAEGKRLAQEGIQAQLREVQAGIAKHQSLERGFETYVAQATNTMNGYDRQLEQFVAEGKRLAQAEVAARQRVIQADLAKYQRLATAMNQLYAVICDQCGARFVEQNGCDMPQHGEYIRDYNIKQQELNQLGDIATMQAEDGQLRQSLNYIANAQGGEFIQELRNDGSPQFSRVVQNYASVEARIAQLQQDYIQKENSKNQELSRLGDIAPLQEKGRQLTDNLNYIANAQGWAFIQELADAGWGPRYNQLAQNCASLEEKIANLNADYANQEARYNQELNQMGDVAVMQAEDRQLTENLNFIINAKEGAFIKELADAGWDPRLNQLAQNYASVEEKMTNLNADYANQEARYNQELNQMGDIEALQAEDNKLTENLNYITKAQGGAFIKELADANWDPRFNQLAQEYASLEERIASLHNQIEQDEAALVRQLNELMYRKDERTAEIDAQKDKWRQQEEEIDRQITANNTRTYQARSAETADGGQFALLAQELDDTDMMSHDLGRDVVGQRVSNELLAMSREYREYMARVASFKTQYELVNDPLLKLQFECSAALKVYLDKIRPLINRETELTKEKEELKIWLAN